MIWKNFSEISTLPLSTMATATAAEVRTASETSHGSGAGYGLPHHALSHSKLYKRGFDSHKGLYSLI